VHAQLTTPATMLHAPWPLQLVLVHVWSIAHPPAAACDPIGHSQLEPPVVATHRVNGAVVHGFGMHASIVQPPRPSA
jgi:hypothetical protein